MICVREREGHGEREREIFLCDVRERERERSVSLRESCSMLMWFVSLEEKRMFFYAYDLYANEC